MLRILRVATATLIVVASLALFSGRAYAHESRMVGPYRFVVGFVNEPAFAGLTNALDLRISDTTKSPAAPVEGLEKTLTTTVTAGGLAPLGIELQTRFGQPGAYAAYFVPTTPGAYTFTIKGKVGNLDVNEKFESGHGFEDVDSTADLQYPVKVPQGDELTKRLDAIQSTADQTRILGLVAIALGVVALGAALLRRRA
ncbi:MAG TPA: hypothetical protein VJQ09_00315 [Candidatus Limnocylindria bacterium]|nr:hypothetical protein [Candidatus Limnocylindria bacterium]